MIDLCINHYYMIFENLLNKFPCGNFQGFFRQNVNHMVMKTITGWFAFDEKKPWKLPHGNLFNKFSNII